MSHTCLFPAFECVECLERLGITDSSRMIVAFARLVDRYLRVDPAPLLDIPAARNWICTAIQSHLPELIENWRGENLPQLLERAHELVPVDWVDLHAELLSYCHGSQAYEWASRKLRAKGFNLSMDQQIDLTEGFLQSGVLARSVSGFDLRKGGGKEASWLKTVYYRYALRELLRRGRARALDDLPDPRLPVRPRMELSPAVRCRACSTRVCAGCLRTNTTWWPSTLAWEPANILCVNLSLPLARPYTKSANGW